MTTKKYIIILPLSYMFMIFVTSSIPGDNSIGSGSILAILITMDLNLFHIPIFGILTLLWIITFKQRQYGESSTLALAAIISTSYGFLDELHQYFVPGRYVSLTDIFLNAIGIFAVICIYKLLLWKNILTFRHSIQ